MWMWILSSMDLFAKIALGGIFWSIAIGVVIAIAFGVAMAIDSIDKRRR